MATILLPRPAQSQPGRLRGIRLGVTLAVTVWFLLVVSLGAVGAFVDCPGAPPFAIADYSNPVEGGKQKDIQEITFRHIESETVVQDLERRMDAAKEPEMREYVELAMGEVLAASVAARAK